jgi:DNA-binding NtrC family response regulator
MLAGVVMPVRVLLVDDKELELQSLSMLLADEGYEVAGLPNGSAALDHLARQRVDVVVTDLQMPGLNGIELTRRAKKLYPDLEVILVTAHASVETAVKAMQEGACHYLVKSPKMGEELLVTLARIARQVTLKMACEPADGAGNEERLCGLVGRSAAMNRVFSLLRSAALHDTTVLLRGETGTGKGLAAAAIHSLSPRKDKPLTTVDCASLPQTLLESELFGHRKGAFTGADTDKEGKVRAAQDSSLFLDEIGELPLASQPKLLRLLEERVFCPLGSNRDITSNARVIASTNRDLEGMVNQGRFRLDLFHRLNVVTIVMPPFRERREDIVPLADFLMARVAKRLGVKAKPLTPETRARFESFEWPGNVRQLVHALERALVVGSADVVRPEDLPPELAGLPAAAEPAASEGGAKEGDSLVDHERRLVEKVLAQTDWNIHESARRLGISRPTLYSKIKRFGLEKRGPGSESGTA